MLDKLSYFYSLTSTILGLALITFLVSKLGDDYSFYVLCVSITTLFSFDFGLGTGVGRIYTEAIARDGSSDKDAAVVLGDYFQLMLFFVIPVLSCLMAIVYLYVHVIFPSLGGEEVSTLRDLLLYVGFPVMVCSVGLTGVDGFFAGQNMMLSNRIIDIIFRIIHVILFLVLLHIYESVVIAYLCQMLGLPISRLIKLIYFLSFHDVKFKRLSYQRTKRFRNFISWITVSMVADKLYLNMIPAILTRMNALSLVGIFGIIQSIIGNYYTLGKSLSGNYISRVTLHYTMKDDRSLLEVLMDYAKTQKLILGGALFIFIMLSKTVLPVMFGVQVIHITGLISILLLSIFIYILVDICYEVVYAADLVWLKALVFSVAAVFNFAILRLMSGVLNDRILLLSITSTYFFIHTILFIF